jgi:phosphatidylserine/phosphatidylglycerophosphate/cardiolipin synthase-like enzyme
MPNRRREHEFSSPVKRCKRLLAERELKSGAQCKAASNASHFIGAAIGRVQADCRAAFLEKPVRALPAAISVIAKLAGESVPYRRAKGGPMRARRTRQGLTVQAIAGSHVVLLGMNMRQEDCNGLLGFAIRRTDYEEEDMRWLDGMKTFEQTDPGFPPGFKYPTNRHPIQGFTWSDFTAKPGRSYTYRIRALAGTPANLKKVREVEIDVTTESEAGGNHDVFFNRGAAASQEYSRRFGDSKPDESNPNDKRWAWLSRGAMEAITAFTARAKSKSWGLRVAAYEFRLDLFADDLRAAHDRGADVRILYDACANPPDEHGAVFPRDANRALASAKQLESFCLERVTRDDVKQPPIAHHKFIVLLKTGKPVAVLTGSTNFSRGGVFGQSNVVHVVESADIAAAYLRCWELLGTNPNHAQLRASLTAINRIPEGLPPAGSFVIFSPQQTSAALDWYAKLAKEARGALFMTFAFGINKVFLDAYANGTAVLRYAMLDKLLAPGVRKEQRPAAEEAMKKLRFMKENRFAVGNRIAINKFDRWVKETLTGLNEHVQYIHTKFMLIDPLGPDPIVITGSANFSDASTLRNDENMLVIRGNKRVADIYLGEYMRLWNHYAFREWAATRPDPADAKFRFLDTTNNWWRQYFKDTDRSRQRQYFSGSAL